MVNMNHGQDTSFLPPPPPPTLTTAPPTAADMAAILIDIRRHVPPQKRIAFDTGDTGPFWCSCTCIRMLLVLSYAIEQVLPRDTGQCTPSLSL